MNQELNPKRCEIIRQVFRDSDDRMGKINDEERSYLRQLNDARRQLSIKNDELQKAKVRGVGANALGLLRGPVAGVTGLVLGNESNMMTMRLEREIKELEGTIIKSQGRIESLRQERFLLQQNDARLSAEAKQLECMM